MNKKTDQYCAENWETSKAGITNKVLPPWTPLVVRGKSVKCWGREYEFAGGLLPSRITTQGKDILAGPIEFELKIGGRKAVVKGARVGMTESLPHKVSFGYEAAAGNIRIRGNAEMEYDGMLKATLSLAPTSTNESIDEFSVIVSLKKEYAELFHYWPGTWPRCAGSSNAGAVPRKGLKLPFKALVWLGNDNFGLSWFTESRENWRNKNEDNALEIIPAGNVVKLKIKIIDKKTVLDRELKYVFGFQATPIKPFLKDWRKLHVAHTVYYEMMDQSWKGSGQISLTYPVKGNVNPLQGAIEFFVQPMFDPEKEIRLPTRTVEMELSMRRVFRGLAVRKIFTLWADKDRDRDRFFGIYWHVPTRSLRVYLMDYAKHLTDIPPVILSASVNWKEGDWHHVAVSYGKKLELYVDNALVASCKHNGLFASVNPDKGILEFGGHQGCDFTIDEIKISDVSRKTYDIQSPAANDEHTLLLDHLDEFAYSGGLRLTKPEKMSARSAEKGGVLNGANALCSDKFGKGLMLCEDRQPRTAMEYLKGAGVNTVVFHEHWSDVQSHPMHGHERELRRLITACHENGMKIVLYFGNGMSTLAPEWKKYHKECLVRNPDEPFDPFSGGWYRMPKQRGHTVCYNSPWQNFTVEAVKMTLESYNIDGVYIDGFTEPTACRNYLHGCGYKAADGTRQPTYPIFAERDLIKRIYYICAVERKGIVNLHQSSNGGVTPLVSFGTAYIDGEQFNQPFKGSQLANLPLDSFRAEFCGRNFGVPAEFLNYPPCMWKTDEAFAFALLHDVMARPESDMGPSLEMAAAVWRAWDKFEVDKAKWFPYWENGKYVKISEPDVKASFYLHHKRKCVLMVVSNFKPGRVDISLRIDLKKLGLPRLGKVVDAISNREIGVCNSKIKLSFDRIGARMLYLET